MAFGPEAHGLLLADSEHGIVQWDMVTRKPLRFFRGHTDKVTNVTVSPDGTRIASVGLDRSLRLWDSTSGQELWRQPADAVERALVVFSPDGQRVMSGEASGEIKIRSVLTGEELRVLRRHSGRIQGTAFSPDGKRIVSSGFDLEVRLWDAETGDQVFALRGHTRPVNAVAFSPDPNERTIASGGYDGTIRFWETGPPPGGTGPRKTAAAAREVLDSLFQKHVFASDVIAALLADTQMDRVIRAAALRIARARGDNPYLLDRESWSVVQKPGGAAEAYALALRKAETAYRGDADHGPIQTTLGAAQYRAGKYKDAVATLTKAESVNKGAAPDLAFLAMAQHQLGRTGDARTTIVRLQQLLAKPEWADDTVAKALSLEAEALLKAN